MEATERLKEELIGWTAAVLHSQDYNGKPPLSFSEMDTEIQEGYRADAKQILFNPEHPLALLTEKELPRIHYGSYMSVKGGTEQIKGWELHERRMREEGFTHSVILL